MLNLPSKIQKLIEWEAIGLIEAEFVRFLQHQVSECDETVLLAAAACMQAQLSGHVCLDLNFTDENTSVFKSEPPGFLYSDIKSKWTEALQKSDLVTINGEIKPLVFLDGRLYLHRFWKYENELAEWLNSKAESTSPISKESEDAIKLFVKNNNTEADWQDIALILSFMRDLLVITGGPGTGKTFAVLKIIAAHNHYMNGGLRVAVAAPTGKAARRLSESIHFGKLNLESILKKKINITEEALTVHKLLGSDYHGTVFKYNSENKLPYDLIIVDEASMLDLNMWINLIRAIPDHAKLIVLGDKDQLSSVEAGSILGDICGGMNAFSSQITKTVKKYTGTNIQVSGSSSAIDDSVVFLTKSYRFGERSGIKKLSDAINRSDEDMVIELLRSDNYPELQWLEPLPENMDKVIEEFGVDHFQSYTAAMDKDALASSNEKKILCALRKTHHGVEYINSLIEHKIKHKIPAIGDQEEWYEGRIIMATKNDTLLKIRNGEIGICKNSIVPEVEFEGEHKSTISVGRLQNYEPAYAMTIHKSQGSEFEEVAIILPKRMSQVLSKEILYTSVTRARRSTLIIGNEEIIRKTVLKSVARSSGLRFQIWKD